MQSSGIYLKKQKVNLHEVISFMVCPFNYSTYIDRVCIEITKVIDAEFVIVNVLLKIRTFGSTDFLN